MVDPTRLTVRDQLHEAVAALAATRRRQLPAVIAIATSIAATLTILTVAGSGAAAVQSELERLRATEVGATVRSTYDGRAVDQPDPADVDRRLVDLDGVVGGGLLTPGPRARIGTAATSAGRTDGPTQVGRVFEASAGAMRLLWGRAPTRWGDDPSTDPLRIVAVGAGLADRLGVSPGAPSSVVIDDVPFAVVEIVAATPRRPELADAMIVPPGVLGRMSFAEPGPGEVLVSTRRGWASAVGARLPDVLAPGVPAAVEVAVQPEPRRLAAAISNRTRSLVLAVATVAWITGLVAIAVTVGAGVQERSAELALRRVFGARPSHLQRHVFTESMIMGVGGGILGCVVGWIATMVAVRAKGWWPVVDWRLWLAAPIAGAITGLLAGILPARSAGRIDPAAGIRRD